MVDIASIPTIILAAVVLVVGLLGNGVVCYVCGCRLRGSSVLNNFVLSLAVLDLVSCVLCLPLEVVLLSYRPNPSPPSLCLTQRFLRILLLISSLFLLVAIATERYRRICRPHTRPLDLRRCRFIIVIAVIVAVFLSWPCLFIFGADDDGGQRRGRREGVERKGGGSVRVDGCGVKDSVRTTLYPVIYFSILFIVFFTACVLLTSLYSRIALTIWRPRKLRTDARTKSASLPDCRRLNAAQPFAAALGRDVIKAYDVMKAGSGGGAVKLHAEKLASLRRSDLKNHQNQNHGDAGLGGVASSFEESAENGDIKSDVNGDENSNLIGRDMSHVGGLGLHRETKPTATTEQNDDRSSDIQAAPEKEITVSSDAAIKNPYADNGQASRNDVRVTNDAAPKTRQADGVMTVDRRWGFHTKASSFCPSKIAARNINLQGRKREVNDVTNTQDVRKVNDVTKAHDVRNARDVTLPMPPSLYAELTWSLKIRGKQEAINKLLASPTPSFRRKRRAAYSRTRTTFIMFLMTLTSIVSYLPYVVVNIVFVASPDGFFYETGANNVANEHAFEFTRRTDPGNSTIAYSEVKDEVQGQGYITIATAALLTLCLKSFLISSAVNPVIYSFCNRKFKAECRRTFRSLSALFRRRCDACFRCCDDAESCDDVKCDDENSSKECEAVRGGTVTSASAAAVDTERSDNIGESSDSRPTDA